MMKKSILSSGKLRPKIFAAISAAAVVLLLALNLLLTYFGLHKTVFVDMTPEGLYTVTERLSKELQFVDEKLSGEVKIIFCADPDTLMKNENSRLTYVMAKKLDNSFDNITTETVNVAYNPTAVDEYRTTALTKINASNLIIAYGDRYRIVGLDSFWVSSGGEMFAYNGEYKLASIIKSVTATERPRAYFVIDHGETYYDVNDKSAPHSEKTVELYNLLSDRGLEVKTLSLKEVSEIPEDCELLIINNPREDYVDKDLTPEEENRYDFVSQTEKLDRYLAKNHGSIMIAKDYALELPILESFLYEWGFDFVDARVSDSTSYLPNEAGDHTTVVGQYDKNENSYAYAIYGDYAALPASPDMVFKNTGYLTCSFGVGTTTPEPGTYAVTRNYDPFFYTTKGAVAYKDNNPYIKDTELHLAAVSTRLEINTVTAEYKYSYIMCAPSADFFSNELLGEAAYANFDIMSALTENMARSDEYASQELGGTSLNSEKLGGKQLADTTMYSDLTDAEEAGVATISSTAQIIFTVIIMLIPLSVAVFGIVICVKRRFL